MKLNLNPKIALSLAVLAFITLSNPVSAAQGLCLTFDRYQNQCMACYKSKPSGKVCGQQLPGSDPCLIYSKYNGRCSICKQGFKLVGGSQCQRDPGYLANCFNEELNGQGQNRCKICLNSYYPNRSQTGCTSVGGEGVPNCEYGGPKTVLVTPASSVGMGWSMIYRDISACRIRLAVWFRALGSATAVTSSLGTPWSTARPAESSKPPQIGLMVQSKKLTENHNFGWFRAHSHPYYPFDCYSLSS